MNQQQNINNINNEQNINNINNYNDNIINNDRGYYSWNNQIYYFIIIDLNLLNN